MVNKYFKGIVPTPGAPLEIDRRLQEVAEKVLPQLTQQMDDLAFNKALASIWELVSASNKYIDETGPWALAKEEKDRPRLGTVLYQAMESLRIIALLLAAFIPSSSSTMWAQLGIEADLWRQSLEEGTKWGGLKPGTKISKPAPLFPRIDPSRISSE